MIIFIIVINFFIKMDITTYINSYFDLSEQNLEVFKRFFKKQTFNKNEFIANEGDHKVSFSFIESGFVRVYKQTETKEITQWISAEQEIVTDLSALMFNTRCVWNLQAITPVTLYSISFRDYHNLKHHILDWESVEKQLLAKCFLVLEHRVFSFLSMSSEERYAHFVKHKRSYFNRVPHYYIASMLGMTPETLSRLRKKECS